MWGRVRIRKARSPGWERLTLLNQGGDILPQRKGGQQGEQEKLHPRSPLAKGGKMKGVRTQLLLSPASTCPEYATPGMRSPTTSQRKVWLLEETVAPKLVKSKEK
jgi:hypothetical protein